MEREQGYTVAITPEAENYYYRDVLEYFYKHHSEASADHKSTDLLGKAIALENNPGIGRLEESLRPLGRMHRIFCITTLHKKPLKLSILSMSRKELYM